MSNPFADLLRQAEAEDQQRSNVQPSGPIGPLEGIVKSGVASIPSLIGIDTRSSALTKWQAEHPMLSLAGELGVSLLPYVGWYKATKLPSLAKHFDTIAVGAKAMEKPIATGALREVVRWTPFEGGRVALAAGFGDPGAWQGILGEAAINVTLGAGIGGLAAGFGGRATASALARREVELSRLFPQFDQNLPRQLKLRQLLEFRNTRALSLGEEKLRTDSNIPTLDAHIGRLKREIWSEQAPMVKGSDAKGGMYVRELLNGGDRQELNRLFYQKGDSKMTNMIRQSPSTIRSNLDRETIEKAFELPRDYEAASQFVRFTNFKTSEAAGKMLGSVNRNMTKVDENSWLAAEKEGLYVVAKRLPGKTRDEDRWMMLKTDQPEIFNPGAQKFKENYETVLSWQPGQVSRQIMKEAESLDIYGSILKLEEIMPLQAVKGVGKGNVDKFAQWAYNRLGYKGDLAAQTGALADIRSIIKSKVAPSMFQFRGNSQASYIFAMSRQAFDHANTRSAEIFHGVLATPKGSVFSAVQKGPAREGGLQEFRRKLSQEEFELFQDAVAEGYDSKQAVEKLGASPLVRDFMDALETSDKWQLNEVNTTAKLTGRQGLHAKPNHLMLSRFWRGDYRMPIYDNNNGLIAMASGYNQKQAEQQAAKWIARAAAKGIQGHTKDVRAFASDFLSDMDYTKKLRLDNAAAREFQRYRAGNAPQTFKERSGVGGYAGEAPDDYLTKDEFFSQLKKHLDQNLKYVADISIAHKFADDIVKVAQADPQLYKQLTQRLNDLAGRPTRFSQAQNQIVDKIMDATIPMGKNSATKIVSMTNSVMVNLQLGMGNVMFPVLNAFTFLQTVMPEVAFVMNAMPESLGRNYTFIPMQGTNRAGGMGFFDMLKFMKNTFHEMKNPSTDEFREHLRRGIAENYIAPRFAEDYVGESASKILAAPGTKAGREADNGYVDWIKSVSEFPIGATERFARGHAFTTGHLLGRQIGLKDEVLYRFAKEFTNNTMFGYSTSDRARMLTGPMGSLFGLFKNWQMHYMGNMLTYTAEGFQRNNWSPLLWQMAGTATVAGTGGLPLIGAADTISRWATDESLMTHLFEAMSWNDRDNTSLEDGIFYGLPGFLGVSMQGSAASPLAEATRDFSMFFSLASFDRAKYLKIAAGDAIDHWITTGQHPFHDPATVQKFVRALGPKSLYRSMQVIEDDALRSLQTGYPIVSNLSMLQRVQYAAGFTPTDVERAYRVNEELWRDMESRKAAIATYGTQLYQASREGDGRLMNRIMLRAVAEGLDTSSIIRSWKARAAKEESENVFDRTFDADKVQGYRQLGIIE